MSIGSNIKKRRYELRMSQQDLADALGYKTRSTIAKIESGENDVTHKKLQRFAEVLDTSIEALVTGGSGYRSIPVQSEQEASIPSNSTAHHRTVAIILAGGKSSRNHQNIPNQFTNILGKPVIVYCLEAYQSHPAIDDIYIVCLKGWEQIVTAYAKENNITKLRGIIPGASTGLLSVQNGLLHIKDRYSDEDIVIIQEATRPLISFDMISKLLQSCYEKGAVNLCHSMKEYLQFSLEGDKTTYIDRESIVCIESPEAYKFKIISSVFEKAKKEQHPLSESCCALLVYNLGYNINFVEAGANNIKIVRQEDVSVASALLRQLINI